MKKLFKPAVLLLAVALSNPALPQRVNTVDPARVGMAADRLAVLDAGI